MASKGILKNSAGKPPIVPTSGPTVVFGRRTDSGRFISYSRDDLDSETSSVNFEDYHVHIPMTPDNQPMDEATKAEEQYVSNSLFTGGFNSVTRAHAMDKGSDSDMGRPATCMVQGCDCKIMRNGRSEDILPCECDFKICVDCFTDAGGACPGCKEPYKHTEWEEVISASNNGVTRALSLHHGPGAKMERSLSLVEQTTMNHSQPGEFDHNRWLFETKGTYGYGNAIWPEDDDDGGSGVPGHPKELMAKPWRPLTRKLRIPAAVISPYRCNLTPENQCHYCYLLLRLSFSASPCLQAPCPDPLGCTGLLPHVAYHAPK